MLIAPSVLAANYAALGQEMERVSTADFIHLDIMDGHFVPNLSFGSDLVAALRTTTTVPFDVHLMVTHPLSYIERFAQAGADIICFHAECDDDPAAVIAAIKKLGKLAAMSVKPGTPAEAIFPYAPQLYMALVMTVEPGFGGQALMEEQLVKPRILKDRFPHLLIEADGGIGRDNIGACAAAGIDIAVAGTSIFKAADPTQEIARLKTLAGN